MAKENKSGPTVMSTKAIGEMANSTDEAPLNMQMGIHILVNLTITFLKGMEHLFIQTVKDMRASSRKAYNTELALKNSLTNLHLVVNSIRAKRPEKALSSGKMAPHTQVAGLMTICMEKVFILGLKGDRTKVVGKGIINMALGFTYGRTKSIKVNGKMANSMVKVCFPGMMVEDTMESGKMAKSMVWVV